MSKHLDPNRKNQRKQKNPFLNQVKLKRKSRQKKKEKTPQQTPREDSQIELVRQKNKQTRKSSLAQNEEESKRSTRKQAGASNLGNKGANFTKGPLKSRHYVNVNRFTLSFFNLGERMVPYNPNKLEHK